MASQGSIEIESSSLAQQIQDQLAKIPRSKKQSEGATKTNEIIKELTFLTSVIQGSNYTPTSNLEGDLQKTSSLITQWGEYVRKSTVRRTLDWLSRNQELKTILLELDIKTDLLSNHVEIQCMKILDLIERKALPEAPRHTSRSNDLLRPLEGSFEWWQRWGVWRRGSLNKSVDGKAGITETTAEYTNYQRKMTASITVTPDFRGACKKLVYELTAFYGRLEDNFPNQSLQPGEVRLESGHNLPRLTILWAYRNVCVKIQLSHPPTITNPLKESSEEFYTLADRILKNIKDKVDSEETTD